VVQPDLTSIAHHSKDVGGAYLFHPSSVDMCGQILSIQERLRSEIQPMKGIGEWHSMIKGFCMFSAELSC